MWWGFGGYIELKTKTSSADCSIRDFDCSIKEYQSIS